MFKKIISIALVFTLSFTLIISGASATTAYASADVSGKQEELDAINKEKAEVTKQINAGKKVVNSLNKDIKDLEGKIVLTQLEINELNVGIGATEQKINEALADLDTLQADIDKQNEDLGKRLRAMYKNGSVGFLDVLLGSNGITDLMTNLDRVKRIYDNDKEVLKTLEVQHNTIEAKRQYLLGLKADLKTSKDAQAAKKDDLAGDKSVVTDKKNQVNQDLKALEEQEDALLAASNALVADILKLQGGGNYIGGSMMWPSAASKRITSYYGMRMHPILKVKKMHTGIDIGAGRGTNVLAANSGTVIFAGWNSGYGNMIMVDHGGGIVTLYAHNDSILVSKGATVGMGDTIAKVGSTGLSTGPHIHFEVRKDGKTVDPTSYVSNK